MYIGLHVKYRYCCQILMKIFSTVLKNTQISNFIIIRLVEAELLNADTDGQTDMTKLVVLFFRNFANAHREVTLTRCLSDYQSVSIRQPREGLS